MQSLVIMSDVHGNRWALEAVLEDAQAHSPDGYVILGDLLADGPDPVGTWALLQGLPNATFVQGNTDRYLGDLSEVVSPRSEMPDLVLTWEWAVDLLGEEGCDFLANLPADALLDMPAGPLLATHAVPGDDERWFEPWMAPELEEFAWRGAQAMLVGHTHIPFVMRGCKGTVINPGSVGLSPWTQWRASYARVDLFPGGQIAVRHLQVDWDVRAYLDAFERGIPHNRKAARMLAALRRLTQA
jgi:predicted phosphodiesterase